MLLMRGGTSIAPARPQVARVDGLALNPAVAIWEITRACQLRCRHCRANAVPRRDPRELSTAEALDLVVQLRALAPGVVVVTGGDPLERPDLFEIVSEVVRQGLQVAIAPSVTPRLTPDAIHRLTAAGVARIALSLDGPSTAMHDALRGTPGSFAATRAAITAVRNAGLPLQVNTSVARPSVGELPHTAELIAEIAPVLWSVFFVVPTGRARCDLELGPDACERVFHFLYEWSERTTIAVKTTAAPAYRRVVVQRDAARRGDGCPRRPKPLAVNDGKGFVFVGHTGDVYPSGFLPLTTGNVRETPLAEIYRCGRLFRALRDEGRLGGKCGVCPFRRLCGGSRARAYAATGDFLAADPSCAYVPSTRAGVGSRE
jgi:radical SAM protein with 4Fe4S-binding SPASM domain